MDTRHEETDRPRHREHTLIFIYIPFSFTSNLFFFVVFVTSYRNWTTAPAVLEFLENNELQGLPLVLQLSLLQQLSYATSRTQQECLIHVMRHAYCFSGLRDFEKDPYSNSVVPLNPAKQRTCAAPLSSTWTSVGKDIPTSPATCVKQGQSQNQDSLFDGQSLFGESSLLSMLGEESESFLSSSQDGTLGGHECAMSPQEQERLATLTYECFLMVKIRYQQLVAFNRCQPISLLPAICLMVYVPFSLSSASSSISLLQPFSSSLSPSTLMNSSVSLPYCVDGSLDTRNLSVQRQWKVPIRSY